MDDFARVLSQADTLLVTEVYAAGEAPIENADGRAICRAVRGRGKVEPVFVPARRRDFAPALTGLRAPRRCHRDDGRGQHQRRGARTGAAAGGVAAPTRWHAMSYALPPEFASRVRLGEPLSRHTSWHVGGPADVFFAPRDRADLIDFLQAAAAGCAAAVAGPRQQPAGARWRCARRRHLHARCADRAGAARRTRRLCRSRRALREAGAPVRALGPGSGGVLHRHSRHGGRCAGHERRRLRRRDLAARCERVETVDRQGGGARAQRRRVRTSATGMSSRPPTTSGSWPPISCSMPVHPRQARARCWNGAGRRSPSASGAAARCSPILRATTPRD